VTSARLLLIASCAIAPTLHGQAAERAVFVVRQRQDTIAVETISRSGRQLEGRLVVRSPGMRLGQQVTLTESSTVERIATSVRLEASGDSMRAELTFIGDSAVGHAEDFRSHEHDTNRRVAVARGSIPYVNLSGLSLELLLRRARALGGDTVRIPVLLLQGESAQATVTRVGSDSLIIVLGGVTLRMRSDAEGRLLGAAVPAQNVTFERLPGDAAIGRWAAASVTVPYAPPPGAPYRAEEVKVRTPSGLTLAGTLTLPHRAAMARMPAVVLITGSGAQDRDEHSAYLPESYRPFRQIADTLSRRGIAVLRLDDRGVGASDAGPLTATSADFANDVRAALAWLRARSDIDPARVGLVGHSEGGIIAPMVAATDPRVRSIVLIAGTASPGRTISEYQIRYLFAQDTTHAPAQRDSLLAVALRQADSAYASPGWLHWFADYDPLPVARRVRVPTLILQGETDRQVPMTEAGRLAAAMRVAGNHRVTARTFPRMNHLMVDDPTGDIRGYGALRSYEVRKDLLGALADWLARTL
jgi:dipeptidyl aminopeptidase/acylaminoacyl peptidase